MRLLLCSLTLLFINKSFAQSESSSYSKIKEISKKYSISIVEDNVNLNELIHQTYKRTPRFHYLTKKDFHDQFLDWNKHLRGYGSNNLKGQFFYPSSPYSPYISYQYAPKIPVLSNSEINNSDMYEFIMGRQKDDSRAPASEQRKRKLIRFAHLTTSQGNFDQKYQSANLSSAQNSPITFGLGGVYFPQSLPSYSLSASAYFSTLTLANVDNSSTLGINSSSVDIPMEVGANVYLQKNITSKFNLYGGIDFEKFSTLNFSDLAEATTDDLAVTAQSMNFLSFGAGYTTKVILPTSFKASISRVITSITQLGGIKYILYANQKITNKYWYHFFYKKHVLTNNSIDEEIRITRLGLGVGMGF